MSDTDTRVTIGMSLDANSSEPRGPPIEPENLISSSTVPTSSASAAQDESTTTAGTTDTASASNRNPDRDGARDDVNSLAFSRFPRNKNDLHHITEVEYVVHMLLPSSSLTKAQHHRCPRNWRKSYGYVGLSI